MRRGRDKFGPYRALAGDHKGSSLRWARANSVLLVNSGSLLGTTAVTSMLGFAYWWVAARRFQPEAVGVASASVAAMALLGGVCVLGLGTLLITELPRQPGQARSLISTALLVVGGAGGAVGFLFAVVAPYVSSGFKPLGASMGNMLLFASGVSLTAMGVVLDQALVGLLLGKLQFWRNTLFTGVKLVALIALGFLSSDRAGMAIYATWALGIVISLAAFAARLVSKKGWPGRDYLPRWSLLRTLGLAALQHHILNMTLQAPILMLPILVTALLSATMNAWFYVSWMVVNFVFLIPNTLTIVLHAMSAAQQSSLARRARVTLGIGVVVSLAANCLLQPAAKQVLSLFGAAYAQQAVWTLRVLLLAAFPLIIKYHYIAICRIQDRIARAMLGMLPGGLLELGAASLGAHLGGLTGLSAGWVTAISIESCFMFRTVAKTVRSEEAQRGQEVARVADAGQPVSGRTEPGRPQGSRYSVAPLPTYYEPIWLLDTCPIPVISMDIVRLTAIKRANKKSEPIGVGGG